MSLWDKIFITHLIIGFWGLMSHVLLRGIDNNIHKKLNDWVAMVAEVALMAWIPHALIFFLYKVWS